MARIWHQALLSAAYWQDKRQLAQTLWMLGNTVSLAQYALRLWSLDTSNAIWTWSWTTGPALSRWVGPDDLWRFLPTSNIVWLCDLDKYMKSVFHTERSTALRQSITMFFVVWCAVLYLFFQDSICRSNWSKNCTEPLQWKPQIPVSCQGISLGITSQF